MRCFLLALWTLSACAPASGADELSAVVPFDPPAESFSVLPPVEDVFAHFLDTPVPVTDGFSVPSGKPCGEGCWATDTRRRVSAVASGKVRSVGEDFVLIESIWYEDQLKQLGLFRYTGVSPTVKEGQDVARGAALGTADTFTLTVPGGDPSTFLAARPRLPVPQKEKRLALVSHDRKQMRLYRDGVEVGTYEVGFGQAEGDKERRGDNRTPKGVYHVMLRSKGPFDGPYGDYYGGHWIKLGYPNPWDAARGVDEGLFDASVQKEITRAFWDRRMPLQGTKLGGGIGIHGWAYEWADEQPRGMSWGCVVVHLRDVGTIYDTLTEGAMVVLF